ncbi:MAG: peptide-methionine (R)-S-oxide reductase MsrB [Croceitalea sp.]|nr:peptide-methionine (R)-S-oxide reductase MsrB [Croceitalea sp.]
MKKIMLLTLMILSACKGNSQIEKETLSQSGTDSNPTEYAVTKTDAEWRASLTDIEYYVLRKAATENAFSSELLNNKEKGTYVCAGCGAELFRSVHKFNSGTGWPSFDRAIEGMVEYDVDYKIGYPRTEEHCARCGGHLGHVFDDGPAATTGKRHCINGVALDFKPDEQ